MRPAEAESAGKGTEPLGGRLIYCATSRQAGVLVEKAKQVCGAMSIWLANRHPQRNS
ncbi:hypothetical protein [uncultured Tateyamaria sp.]|uniref:hypothetical protein n=1 Tax=uncultured Tateyamaria sp. TaxID=455651 RepID=UPI002617FA94|nr:hypothetical protein [uncultured Tateyamaria sp.]